jgi:hypothetical protein
VVQKFTSIEVSFTVGRPGHLYDKFRRMIAVRENGVCLFQFQDVLFVVEMPHLYKGCLLFQYEDANGVVVPHTDDEKQGGYDIHTLHRLKKYK